MATPSPLPAPGSDAEADLAMATVEDIVDLIGTWPLEFDRVGDGPDGTVWSVHPVRSPFTGTGPTRLAAMIDLVARLREGAPLMGPRITGGTR